MPRAVGSSIGVPGAYAVAGRDSECGADRDGAPSPASNGSQAPKRSRNPSTLAGLNMPDTISPMPKTRPEVKAANGYMTAPLRHDDVTDDEHRREARRHERDRRDDGARRQPRHPADAMAARAARAVARADADGSPAARAADSRRRSSLRAGGEQRVAAGAATRPSDERRAPPRGPPSGRSACRRRCR